MKEYKTIKHNSGLDLTKILDTWLEQGWTIRDIFQPKNDGYPSSNHTYVTLVKVTKKQRVFTKEELQHIKDHLSYSFRGYPIGSVHYEGSFAQQLEYSIKKKLNIKE